MYPLLWYGQRWTLPVLITPHTFSSLSTSITEQSICCQIQSANNFMWDSVKSYRPRRALLNL